MVSPFDLSSLSRVQNSNHPAQHPEAVLLFSHAPVLMEYLGLDKLRKFESEDDALESQVDHEIEVYDGMLAADNLQIETRFDHVGDVTTIVFSDTNWLFNKIKESVTKESLVKEVVSNEIKDGQPKVQTKLQSSKFIFLLSMSQTLLVTISLKQN